MAAAFGYCCPSCGMYMTTGTLHVCPSIPTPIPTTYSSPSYTYTSGVSWTPYTAATPPPDGDYLVATVNKFSGYRTWRFSKYIMASYEWTDVYGTYPDDIVTHYARIELP